MNCIFHQDRIAIGNCAECGISLCNDCTINTQGKTLCRKCLLGDSAVPHLAAASKLNFNRGLLFLFCVFLPPGAGYMYMGLVKRGLCVMLGFFFLIFLLTTGLGTMANVFIVLSFPVIYLTCIFDSFSIRRRLICGEAVEDGVGSMVNALLSNKKLCVFLLVVLTIIFAGSILGFAIRLLRGIIPLLIIAFGLYVIFRRKK